MTRIDNVLNFPNGGEIIFSAHDPHIIAQILIGSQKHTDLGFGMSVQETRLIKPDYNDELGEYFFYDSPIHITQF